MRKLARLSIAIGGFLIMASLMLTCVLLLVMLNLADVNFFANQTTMTFLTLMFIAIAALDFMAGVILLREMSNI
jgi:hypothetical protein